MRFFKFFFIFTQAVIRKSLIKIIIVVFVFTLVFFINFQHFFFNFSFSVISVYSFNNDRIAMYNDFFNLIIYII